MINGGEDLRVAAYIRVSTDEQAEEGYSIESQKAAVRSYCATYRWRVVEWYVDEGYSAYSGERRPAFERMMAQTGTWDVAVAKWFNRFWRRVLPALSWAQDMQKLGKDFACVVDRIDTSTAMGRAMFQMVLVMAELESGQTSERVQAAFAQKLEQDESPWFTRPPLGYVLQHDDDNHGGRLVVDEAEAAIIRRMFTMAAKGTSATKISATLRSSSMRGKAGGHFFLPQVLHILHNPVYAGYVYYRGVLRRAHAPILTDEEFNEVQLGLYTRGKKARGRWPLIVGAGRIEAERILTSGNVQAVYVPKERPADLDELVAQARARQQ